MRVSKNIIMFLFFSLLTFVCGEIIAGERNRRGRLSISNIQIQNIGDSIRLCFDCIPDLAMLKKKERIIVTPVIFDSIRQTTFSSFAIVGKKEKTAFIRSVDYQTNMKITDDSGLFAYKAAIKYADWMKGSTLAFNTVTKLCAKRFVQETVYVKGKVLQDPDIKIVEIVKAVEPVLSTAEKLALDYTFLIPVSQRIDFDKTNRKDAVSVLFCPGSSILSSDYQNNGKNLDLLVSIIDEINRSSDSRITDILIIGYASPEGRYRLNLDFAEKRAVALRDYLVQETDMPVESFKVINGGIDWQGLYQLVNESDMVEKEEILKIIAPSVIGEEQVRNDKLIHLRDGVPYRYMLKNFFPQLRSSTCVRIFYKNVDGEK